MGAIKTLGAAFLAAAAIWGAPTAQASTYVVDAIPVPDKSWITDEVMDTVRRIAGAYPEIGQVTVTAVLFTDKLTYAAASNSLLLLNEYMLWNPSYMLDNLRNDVQSGWHRGGCTLVSSLAVHEMGHVIERAHGRRALTIAYEKYGLGRGLPLSQYSFNKDGTVNWAEALAEAFEATYCGVNNETEQAIYRILVTS